MLAFSYISAILVTLVPVVSANFDLNVVIGDVSTIFPWPDQIGGWMLTDGDDPKCEDLAENGVIAAWDEKNDLSHGREGIRCSPNNHCGYHHFDDVSIKISGHKQLKREADFTQDPWPSVEVVEMHFTNNPLHHYSKLTSVYV